VGDEGRGRADRAADGRVSTSARADKVRVGDAAYDAWEVVRDFEDADTARAWRQHLDEAGIEAVLTADWPLDRFGRGDIALRVRPETWGDAEALLSNYD
jgi:hypothetical protein